MAAARAEICRLRARLQMVGQTSTPAQDVAWERLNARIAEAIDWLTTEASRD